MRRKSKGGLGAIAAVTILVAAQPAALQAALSYDISLGAGVQLNDNLHLDPRTSGAEGLRQPVQETIFTINPGIVVLWDAEHDRLQLRYNGEYSMFQGDEERDSFWAHTIAADLSWRRWSPFFLEAREERSRVPRTQERSDEALVDQVDRNLVFVRTGLVSEMGPRSTVELAYRGELETFPGDETADRVERQFGEALVRHRWSPLWRSELRAAFGQVDRKLVSDYDELRVSVAVDQRWSERLALRYRLEWLRDDDDKPALDAVTGAPLDTVRNNLLLALELRGDLERGGSWNLAYQDTQADQPDGDTLKTGRAAGAASFRARLGSTLDIGAWHESRDYRESGREEAAWGPTLGVRWMIAKWAALDLAGSWTDTTIRQANLPAIGDHTTRVAAGVVLLLFEQLQLDVGYGYRENNSTDTLRSYANNLFFALLTFHFRPVEPGRIPSSYAAGFVAGGTPSGGSEQAGAGGGAPGSVR